MSEEALMWARLIIAVIALVGVVMATFFAVSLAIEQRRPHLVCGAIALAGLVAQALLRIAVIPEPRLLPQTFIDVASLSINAVWTLSGLTWLTLVLRSRFHEAKLRSKYSESEMENGQ